MTRNIRYLLIISAEGLKLTKGIRLHINPKRIEKGEGSKKADIESAGVFKINEPGFTLIEIMIALAITGIASIIILNTVNYHVDLMHENIQITRMYQLAKEKMYDLEAEMSARKGSDPDTGFSFESSINRLNALDIMELKTTVTNGNRIIVLNNLITRKKDEEDKKTE